MPIGKGIVLVGMSERNSWGLAMRLNRWRFSLPTYSGLVPEVIHVSICPQVSAGGYSTTSSWIWDAEIL